MKTSELTTLARKKSGLSARDFAVALGYQPSSNANVIKAEKGHFDEKGDCEFRRRLDVYLNKAPELSREVILKKIIETRAAVAEALRVIEDLQRMI